MNNNLNPSSSVKCYCGRYASIGETTNTPLIHIGYECPDCFSQRYSKPITPEKFYNDFEQDFNFNTR